MRVHAHANELYWQRETSRHDALTKTAAIITALTSGSVAISSWGIWATYPVFWKVLTGIAAVVAVFNAVHDFKAKTAERAVLHAKWIDLFVSAA